MVLNLLAPDFRNEAAATPVIIALPAKLVPTFVDRGHTGDGTH